jgi:cytosine/adenosine deaminase-related metal-dependent hydrolase
MSTTVLEGAHIYVGGPSRTELAGGHVIIQDNRITGVGGGSPAPDQQGRRIDVSGCLITAGLVNTHHHLYQWVTRGLAVDGTLFEWLTTLYPVWANLDEDITRTAATAALAWLARTGCTTSTDHHYVFPHGGGDLLGAEIEAARTVGLRFHPTRGSMDLGQSDGGLPPDQVVEDLDSILTASEKAIQTHHDASFDSMLRIALAPCSPFSVSADLLRESADLARRHDVRLHTHLCETSDEVDYCRERFGATPVEYMESLGWLGPDVWYAHTVHLDDRSIARMAAT